MTDQALGNTPALASLSAGERGTLAASARRADYAPGEVLYVEGNADDHISVLVEGEVEIVKALGTTDERRLAVCRAGSLLGEMSLFSADGTHTASVRALTKATVLAIDRAEFDALLQRRPGLAYALMRLLSQRLDAGEHITIRELRDKNRRLTEAYDELQTAQALLVEKERLERELELARGMQQSMLPQVLPDVPGYDLGAMMIPARLVGGDFYDVIPLRGGRLVLLVGDVCGKGVTAALFMAQCFSLLRAEAGRCRTPRGTLLAVNRHLLSVNRSDMYVTLLYAVLDTACGRLDYARAGHPPLVILDAQHRLVPLPLKPGQMLGTFERPLIDAGSVTLAPGGLALLYSDGLAEALDAHGDEYSPERIAGAVRAARSTVAQSLCAALWVAAQAHTPEPGVQDDFAVLAIRRLGDR